MKRLQAILFGAGTLVDQRDVERKAYNRVFDEAGLSWNWDAREYARLARLASGGDVLDAFIGFERPRWRNSDDLKHLLTAVRRRHAALCRALASDFDDIDQTIVAVAAAARRRGLRLAAIVPSSARLPGDLNDVAVAQTYHEALAAIDMPASGCLAIECTADGFQSAAEAGVVALDKLAVSAGADASSDAAVMALFDDVHSNSRPLAQRFPAIALIA